MIRDYEEPEFPPNWSDDEEEKIEQVKICLWTIGLGIVVVVLFSLWK